MFKKVLVAEDFQDTNFGIANTLRKKLGIEEVQEELYCDKALTRLKVAHNNSTPFQLLITDIHFKESHIDRRVGSGIELIEAAKKIQPDLKVIVNSMEDNPIQINKLFKEFEINGYVCKGRHGLTELSNAIHEVYHKRTFFSPQINLNVSNNVFELDEFDQFILQYLADGYTKKEISEIFKRENVTPNSESTIDKRISKLYDEYGAKNTTNLLFKLVKEGRM